jgi:hypothetical protein
LTLLDFDALGTGSFASGLRFLPDRSELLLDLGLAPLAAYTDGFCCFGRHRFVPLFLYLR